MNAIESIAISAIRTGARTCFYGETEGSADTSLIPRDTPENRAGVSAQTQCPCGFAGGDTSDTPDTCQKTEVQVKHAKKGPEMGANDVTAWAKKRLAEAAFLNAPAPTPTPAPAPTPTPPPPSAPAPHGAHTVPAPDQPQALGWLHMERPWRVADRLYEAHHWQCSTCKSAATGHTARCPEGQHLHDAYTQAAMAAMKGHPHD